MFKNILNVEIVQLVSQYVTQSVLSTDVDPQYN